MPREIGPPNQFLASTGEGKKANLTDALTNVVGRYPLFELGSGGKWMVKLKIVEPNRCAVNIRYLKAQHAKCPANRVFPKEHRVERLVGVCE